MGNRLSAIATRTGDDGSTGLGDGRRVRKTDARIVAIGDVDELNSALGVVLAEALPPAVRETLSAIQHDLFELGGELSIPGREAIGDAHLARLDLALKTFNAELAPLLEFILPGGCRAAACTHIARTVCRRAERSVLRLEEGETVSSGVRRYLNRLSDLLFVLARVINDKAGQKEMLWKSERVLRAQSGGDA